MMKILRAVAFAACFLTAAAQAVPASHAIADVDSWPVADLQDVTQAWYFTGEALAPYRDGPPWATERPLFRPADLALAPPAPSVMLARVHAPATIAEPHMASMLLVGAVLIFLRAGRKQELFG